MTRRIREGLKVLGAFLVPLGVAAAWVPIRTRLPNADLALVLVLVVVAVGAAGRRLAVLASAASSAFWFDFFDTRPFEHPSIQRTPDLETTLVLAAVAFVGGELAIQIVRHRSRARSDAARLTSISDAASLLASGEELALVVQAVGQELGQLLHLRSCTFEVAPSNPERTRIRRTGELIPPEQRAGQPDGQGLGQVELPVWGHRHVFGHFVLEFPQGAPPPGRVDLVAAVALGDQVGAAFMTQAPAPPDPADQPSRGLRVVR
jgi:K+-sensing histidine kinase KdpD